MSGKCEGFALVNKLSRVSLRCQEEAKRKPSRSSILAHLSGHRSHPWHVSPSLSLFNEYYFNSIFYSNYLT